MSRRTKPADWLRPNVRCGKCGKGPSVRIDPQLARLIRYMLDEHGVDGRVRGISIKCTRCRHVYPVSLEACATQVEPEPA